MSNIEFLIDENILGIDRYLENNVKYRKVGDESCIPKGSPDHEVAKFAKDNNLIIVTNDENLIKQCKLFEIKFIILDLIVDLAKKVLKYHDLN